MCHPYNCYIAYMFRKFVLSRKKIKKHIFVIVKYLLVIIKKNYAPLVDELTLISVKFVDESEVMKFCDLYEKDNNPDSKP